MRLSLPERQEQRISKVLEIAVIAAAVATMPLTYAHMQEWEGLHLVVLDWLLWAIFATEYSFAMAVSRNRLDTTKKQWLNLTIVVLSFPPLPHLLGLTRLVRLVRPIRLVGGMRIWRPLVLARLYVMRSVGSRRAFNKAKDSEPVDAARSKLGEVKDGLGSKIARSGEESD